MLKHFNQSQPFVNKHNVPIFECFPHRITVHVVFRLGRDLLERKIVDQYRINAFIIHWTRYLFWLAKSVQWIFEICACDVITADYTIIMSRTLKVTGNHVMYDRGAWFLRVIISSSRFVLLAVSVRVISLGLRHRLITPTSTSIILDITKTSSNNCLVQLLEVLVEFVDWANQK